VKKTNIISLINAKAFSQDIEKGAPFVILITREVNEEPNTLIAPKVTLVIMEWCVSWRPPI